LQMMRIEVMPVLEKDRPTVTKAPLKDGARKAVGLAGIAPGITESKEVRKELAGDPKGWPLPECLAQLSARPAGDQGALPARSQGPGHGAAFTLELPVQRA
jgi:hypothetical protein